RVAHPDSALSGIRFRSTRSGDTGHQQTNDFSAFRLANLPSLYFTCSVRLCKDADAKFCSADAACKDAKMSKRSPNDGIQLVESWAHIVVMATANRRTE
uniref:ZP domain-containing protein n=2 Tax=Macrostomum lignano TaxID=282301 RepID=A0A1I8I6T9_9PLAT